MKYLMYFDVGRGFQDITLRGDNRKEAEANAASIQSAAEISRYFILEQPGEHPSELNDLVFFAFPATSPERTPQ